MERKGTGGTILTVIKSEDVCEASKYDSVYFYAIIKSTY